MTVYIIDAQPFLKRIRYIIIKAKNRKEAIEIVSKRLIELMGSTPDFDLSLSLSERLRIMKKGEVIYVG